MSEIAVPVGWRGTSYSHPLTAEMEDLARQFRTADHCHGLVIRDGEQDACGKPPVAIIDGRATEDAGYWPACAWHANRYGPCAPLSDIRSALAPRPSAHAEQEGE